MSAIDKLTEYFTQFPGIGPRQARRFVYFLLTRNTYFLDEFIELISSLKKEVTTCTACYRFFAEKGSARACRICSDTNRDETLLMVVAKDADLENIERSGVYNGHYFVLGGIIPILETKRSAAVRTSALNARVKKRAAEGVLKEVILAFAVNPEGENTTEEIKKMLLPTVEKHTITLSTPGRGLSSGIELEYPDSETIKNALLNRH